jgi:hypothetical protein
MASKQTPLRSALLGESYTRVDHASGLTLLL